MYRITTKRSNFLVEGEVHVAHKLVRYKSLKEAQRSVPAHLRWVTTVAPYKVGYSEVPDHPTARAFQAMQCTLRGIGRAVRAAWCWTRSKDAR